MGVLFLSLACLLGVEMFTNTSRLHLTGAYDENRELWRM